MMLQQTASVERYQTPYSWIIPYLNSHCRPGLGQHSSDHSELKAALLNFRGVRAC